MTFWDVVLASFIGNFAMIIIFIAGKILVEGLKSIAKDEFNK